MDSSEEAECTIVSSYETPPKRKIRPLIPTTGGAAGSYTTSLAPNDSLVIPIRTPDEVSNIFTI